MLLSIALLCWKFQLSVLCDSSSLVRLSQKLNFSRLAIPKYTTCASRMKKKLAWKITSKKKIFFANLLQLCNTLTNNQTYILPMGQSENHSISISIVDIVNVSNFFARYSHFLTVFTNTVIY